MDEQDKQRIVALTVRIVAGMVEKGEVNPDDPEALKNAARALVRPIPAAGLSFQECSELDDAKATLERIAKESGT
jgi:hypothetical protein